MVLLEDVFFKTSSLSIEVNSSSNSNNNFRMMMKNREGGLVYPMESRRGGSQLGIKT